MNWPIVAFMWTWVDHHGSRSVAEPVFHFLGAQSQEENIGRDQDKRDPSPNPHELLSPTEPHCFPFSTSQYCY